MQDIKRESSREKEKERILRIAKEKEIEREIEWKREKEIRLRERELYSGDFFRFSMSVFTTLIIKFNNYIFN